MMPSAFAVFRLITSSNLVGCSTGRSAGFAPLKILSTKAADRRNRSRKSIPYVRSKPASAYLSAAAIGGSRFLTAMVRNLATIVEQHTIAQHDERLRALPHHRRERLFKCVQPACFGRDKASTRAPGQPLASTSAGSDWAQSPDSTECPHARGSAVFPSATQAACKLLAARVLSDPGDVPAGTRQTGDKPGTNRIDTAGHDDRDGRGRLHGRNRVRIDSRQR